MVDSVILASSSTLADYIIYIQNMVTYSGITITVEQPSIHTTFHKDHTYLKTRVRAHVLQQIKKLNKDFRKPAAATVPPSRTVT